MTPSKSDVSFLVQAMERDDITEVKRLISEEVDVREVSPSNSSLLLRMAVSFGYLEIVEILLNSGVEPHGSVLLQLLPASDPKTLEILSALIAAKVDLDYPLEERETLLIKAAGDGELEFVTRLVEAGADVNNVSENGETALLCAACAGRKEVYDYLAPKTLPEHRIEAEKHLARGLRYRERKDDVKISKLFSAVTRAAMTGDLQELLAAIAEGVDVNVMGASDQTALSLAANWGLVSVVRVLIENGADVNLGTEEIEDFEGSIGSQTPLMEAAARAKYEVARLLIEAGADVNASTKSGWTALIAAANTGNVEVTRLLLDAGADINAKDDRGDTALSRAKQVAELARAGELFLSRMVEFYQSKPDETLQLLRERGAKE